MSRSALAQHCIALADCTRCLLWNPYVRPVAALPLGNVRLLVVGQAPGKREYETRLPFSGKSGHILQRWLTEADCDVQWCGQHAYLSRLRAAIPGQARADEETGSQTMPSNLHVLRGLKKNCASLSPESFWR